ncbi:SIS domain-containing protein [Actinoplanes bogorensis]|uniref:SIS domain-containing protein n=1 Tax=Paractinoplanes bogorensis TaxID=1610840 RepID=A0ABS5YN69_9ACTN|nr:SIS domain-containing protein [Actinoplanes bogorensis]MBU2664915.1 SIS domain-containing protein [Actinoplanes bogorensis]
MTAQLERMIAAQAEVVASLGDPALTEEAARKLAGARRVWLIGTGTSLHAAELGAAELARAGLDSRAIAANMFDQSLLRDGDAAVVITHTGHTAYAVRSRALLLDAGVPLISITGPDVDWPEAVRTPIAEASETYTVSYTAALVVLAQLAHHLGAPGGGPDAVRVVAEAIIAADAAGAGAGNGGSNGDTAGVGANRSGGGVDVPMPARAMAIVGPGLWSITAREGALKIREGARILCEGFDTDRLLHGGAVPYTPADTLLVLQPDELTSSVRHAARLERLQVVTWTSAVTTGSPLLDQIPMTVRLQRLALRFARLRGQDADLAITGAWADPELWP